MANNPNCFRTTFFDFRKLFPAFMRGVEGGGVFRYQSRELAVKDWTKKLRGFNVTNFVSLGEALSWLALL